MLAKGRLGRSALVRNTGWMTVAQGGKLLVQAAYFVLVARALGPRGFGAFAAALALVSILAPFAALGTGNLLVMHVARRPQEFGRRFGNALVAIPLAGLPLLALALLLRAVAIPGLSLRLVLALGIAELFLARLVDTAAQAFQAYERMLATAVLSVVAPACRLVGAVAFVAAAGRTAESWAIWYLAGTAVAGALALAVAVGLLGAPRPDRDLGLRDLPGGVGFSLAQSSANIYTDIDKTMLARLSSLGAAGIYAAAYRATAMAFVPVVSLLYASYARFFRHGEEGIRGSLGFARRLLPFAVLYGAGSSVVLFAAAPLFPLVLGREFESSTGALRWLAALPLIQALYYLAGDTLTGAGRQGLRSLVQLAAAVLNVGLNLVLIPAYGWEGAAWSTLASLGFLAVALWAAVAVLARPATDPVTRESPRLASV
jgi:O-antigen/teichoic acid export membrane protein